MFSLIENRNLLRFYHFAIKKMKAWRVKNQIFFGIPGIPKNVLYHIKQFQ